MSCWVHCVIRLTVPLWVSIESSVRSDTLGYFLPLARLGPLGLLAFTGSLRHLGLIEHVGPLITVGLLALAGSLKHHGLLCVVDSLDAEWVNSRLRLAIS